MIVIGYQGIGKSTLAGRNNRFIDLESGNFWFYDEETKQKVRHGNWYKPYCNIAEHLSKQGYIVFVSSHEVVRKQLENSSEEIVVCYPDIKLKDEWIEKLKKRYEESGLEKDYKALMNAKDRYDENIREMSADIYSNHLWNELVVKQIDYDLEVGLIHLINILNKSY